MFSIRIVLVASVCLTASLWADEPNGEQLYVARCASCHQNSSQARIPKREDLAKYTPEAIVNVMFAGAMMTQSTGLTQEEGRAIAKFITGKEFSEGAKSTGLCEAAGKKFELASGDWNGWGTEPGNSRYQTKPGLTAADVPKLKLKWAFAFPNDSVAFSQPALVGGRVFVGSGGGKVYSLDAGTGCTYWSYEAGASVRTAITISRDKGGKYVAYFGDVRAFAHAVDAETGKPLWKVKLDEHPIARITGSPTFYDGRLYVPLSSIEEASATSPKYECCKFRGSVVALDAETGHQIWKSYTVLDPPKAFKQNKAGTQMYGPAGAAIWSSPTVDPKRKVVYAATGDSYTDVDFNTSDAVLAIDMETGHLLWSNQVLKDDNFVIGCPTGVNCPEKSGPDYDFGTSPILRQIGGGKSILVVGQKSGIVWGLDPDQKGKVVWQTKLGVGSALGGVEWGHAADDKNTYVAISDRIVREGGTPGLYALNLATGDKVWSAPAPKVTCAKPQGCLPGQSAAISVIPGVVFSGALNGHFRAYAATTGEILWDFDTYKPFDTVNNVPGKGGSIDGPGPTIADGMVLTNSGYGNFGGAPGNVLLAFTVDGK